jgi:uncharacterized membrane protein YfcA
MFLGFSITLVISIILIAFFCEYVDSTLGMGYGTTMTPLLLMFGFTPLQVVPAVLLSELFTGITAGVLHNREGNVNFRLDTKNLSLMIPAIRSLGIRESFKKGIPLHLRVALTLFVCGITGAIIAVSLAKIVSQESIKLYIGILVIAMGIVIVALINKDFKFSWIKIGILGFIASFNKGLTGGGYGPIIVSGQIISGVQGKSAVGITSLAEGLTCIVGVICYIFMSKTAIDWRLAPIMILGALASVPFSAKSVKLVPERKMKLAIGVLTIILGIVSILKTLKVF